MRRAKFLTAMVAGFVLFAQPILPVLAKESMAEIAKNAGDHLAAMQKPEGNFFYEFHPFTGEYSSEDNIVRQFGTMYSMAELYALFGDPIYLDRLEKTADYWLARSETATSQGKTLRFFPEKGRAILGCAALFLIGTRTLKQHDASWWAANAEAVSDVENFLFWMQKKDGSFAASFESGMTFEEKELTSSSEYYDGESMLALAALYEDEQVEGTKVALYKALEGFEKLYGSRYAKGFYLWAMTAARRAYELFGDPRFVDFADEQEAQRGSSRSLTAKKLVKNVCWDLEGLGNWLVLKKSIGMKHREQEEYFFFGLSQMARLQLKKSSRLSVRLDARARGKEKDGPSARLRPKLAGIGGFLTDLRRPVQRIDYQQHCISAFKAGMKLRGL